MICTSPSATANRRLASDDSRGEANELAGTVAIGVDTPARLTHTNGPPSLLASLAIKKSVPESEISLVGEGV